MVFLVKKNEVICDRTEPFHYSRIYLYHTASIQLDLSLLLFLVFTDVVDKAAWLKRKPALMPIPTYISLFQHVTLKSKKKL